MGYATLQPRRIKSLCLEKSACGDFFTKAVILSLGNPSDPLKTRQKIEPTPTKTALGVLYEHYRYSAFGEAEIYNTQGQKLVESAIDNDVLWNSRRFDGDTGLYYYKYRHYKSDIGRWLGRDPIEERGGMNLYSFVGNDPIYYWDLFGLKKPKVKLFKWRAEVVKEMKRLIHIGGLNSLKAAQADLKKRKEKYKKVKAQTQVPWSLSLEEKYVLNV